MKKGMNKGLLCKLSVLLAIVLVLGLAPVLANAAADTDAANTGGDMNLMSVIYSNNSIRFFNLYNSIFYAYLKPGETLTITVDPEQNADVGDDRLAQANDTSLQVFDVSDPAHPATMQLSYTVNAGAILQNSTVPVNLDPTLNYQTKITYYVQPNVGGISSSTTGRIYMIQFGNPNSTQTSNLLPRRPLTISVSDTLHPIAPTSSVGIPGRIWADTINLVQRGIYDTIDTSKANSLYVLGSAGDIFKVDFYNYWSDLSTIQFSYKGLVTTETYTDPVTGESTTTSTPLNQSRPLDSNGQMQGYSQDTNLYKIFFDATPDQDLMNYFKSNNLNQILPSADILNNFGGVVKFEPAGADATQPRVGTIYYWVNQNYNGRYYIQVTAADGTVRSIPMDIAATDNHGSPTSPISYSFDGIDGNGQIMGFSAFNIAVTLYNVSAGQGNLYAVLNNVRILGGLSIAQINGLVGTTGNSKVYWDDTPLSSGNFSSALYVPVSTLWSTKDTNGIQVGVTSLMSSGTNNGVHGWANTQDVSIPYTTYLLSNFHSWGTNALVETWIKNATPAGMTVDNKTFPVPTDTTDSDHDGVPNAYEWGHDGDITQKPIDSNNNNLVDYLDPLKVFYDANGGTINPSGLLTLTAVPGATYYNVDNAPTASSTTYDYKKAHLSNFPASTLADALGTLPTATRTNYTFLGWSTNPSSPIPTVTKTTQLDYKNLHGTTPPCVDQALYAVWLYSGPLPDDYPLQITKVISGTQTSFNPGDTVNFTITVTNKGSYDLHDVAVYDVVDTGTGAQIGTIPVLTAGASQPFTYSYTVPAGTQPATTIKNLAYATSSDLSLPAYATVTFTTGKLQINFDPNGGTLVGTVSSKNVDITQPIGTLPTATRNGYIFLGWSENKDSSVPTVTAATVVNFDASLSDSTSTATPAAVTFNDNPATLYAIYMNVGGSDPNKDGDNDTSTDGALKITKSLADGQSNKVIPGSTVNYVITVTNTSKAGDTGVTLTNVVVVDVIAGQTTLLGTVPSLAPGASKTFPFAYTVPNNAVLGDTITNAAFATCDNYPGGRAQSNQDVQVSILTSDHIWYMRGYPDGSFKPNGNLTRAEAAMAFYRLLNPSLKTDLPTSMSGFPDVNSTDWFGLGVYTLAKYNILTGYPDGSFKPNQYITRAELAAMLARFMNLANATIANPYSDVDSSHWAYNAILSCTAQGWLQGDGAGATRTFRPDSPVTRAEFVTAVNNMLNRHVQLSDLQNWMSANKLSKIPNFTDVFTTHWAYTAIIEASCTHDFTRQSDGKNETWIIPIVETGLTAAYNQ